MRKLFASVLTAAVVAVTLLSGTATASASGEVGVTGVGNQVCDFGEVCLFAWPNYDGPTWDANGCGWHILDGWMQNQTSSVRTHGNAVTLWNWNDYDSGPDRWVELFYLPSWWEHQLYTTADRADAITVHC
jgi:hypothetical protein